MTAKTYDRQSGKLIAQIEENLPEMSGDVMQGWIDNPRGLQKFLSGLCPSFRFPTWKTIKLGTGLQSADEFREALKNGGFCIGSWGDNILGKPAFKAATKETEIELINVSVAELGFKNCATRADIYKKALELGLELCPNEVGPQLRLQYRDQPKGELLLIAMEPITDSSGDLGVFYVEHYSRGLWLYCSDGRPDFFWDGDNSWVFARRK